LVVLELAAETSSFEEFRSAVAGFVAETNEPAAMEWAEALALVRAGKLELPGYRRQDAASSATGAAVALVATQRAEELPASSPPLQATLNEPTRTKHLSHVAIAA
jgi:hypothetical protein